MAKLAGFIMSRLAADEAEILSVAVAGARHGRGLARRLLDLHLRRLAGLGCRAVFLEVDEHNAPAIRLYDRAGFREISRRANYYPVRRRANPPRRWCCAAIWPDREALSLCYETGPERLNVADAGPNTCLTGRISKRCAPPRACA